MTQGILMDVYDGAIWKAFQLVDNKPFLQVPNNLCMKLNLDWFNPFEPYNTVLVSLSCGGKPSSVGTL